MTQAAAPLAADAEPAAPAPEGKAVKPIKKLRIGSVHAAVWRNGAFYAATFERRYPDANKAWQSTGSFGVGALLNLAKAADRAHDAILGLLKDAQ